MITEATKKTGAYRQGYDAGYAAGSLRRKNGTLVDALNVALKDFERIFNLPSANLPNPNETNIASLAHSAGSRIRQALIKSVEAGP